MRKMDVAMMCKKFSSSTSHRKGFKVPKEEERNAKSKRKNVISVNHSLVWCGVVGRRA